MAEQQRPGWLFWAGCLGLAMAVRCINYGPVMGGDSVYLVGTDAYFHLRRILYTVRHFPSMLTFDPYLGHPYGATVPYEPGLDFLLAALSRILTWGSAPGDGQVLLISAAAMPFLGLLLLPIYAGLTREVGGLRAQRACLVLLAILPAVAFPSQLGQVDHHVLEPILSGAIFWMVIKAVRTPFPVWPITGAAVTLGGGLLFWRGIILPAVLLAGALGIRALRQIPAGGPDAVSRRRGPALLIGAGLVALAIGVAGPSSEPFTYFAPSLLQPAILVLLGLGLWALGMTGSLLVQGTAEPPTRQRIHTTLGVAALSGLTPLLLALLLSDTFRTNILAGLGFLGRTDPFVLAVGEQRPLFSNDDGGFSLLYVLYFYGALVFLLPLGMWRIRQDRLHRRRERGGSHSLSHDAWWILSLWTVQMAILALLQRRYAVHFGPLLAIWMGLAFEVARDRLRRKGPLVKALAALVSAGALAPPLGLTLIQTAIPVQSDALIQAMGWIRTHTPPTSGYDPSPGQSAFSPPEYGILAAWDEGHHLLTLAQRANIGNPFGIEWFKPGLERSARCWLAEGDALAQVMDDTGARYTLTSFRLGLLRDEARFLGRSPDRYATFTDRGWMPGPDYPKLGMARLYLSDGLARESIAPMESFRLIWEGGTVRSDSPAARLAGAGAPEYKLFERVAGAVIRGTAPPGETVVAWMDIRTPAGRTFEWRWTGTAGPEGSWSLRSPYASVGMEEGFVRAAGPITILIGERDWKLTLGDSDVRMGRQFPLETSDTHQLQGPP